MVRCVNGELQLALDCEPVFDYGRRRDALRTWEIPPGQWQELIDGLPGQLIKNRLVPQTHWGDGKRRLVLRSL